MLLLAIDTSTAASAVALLESRDAVAGDAAVLAEVTTLNATGHTEALAPNLAAALERAGRRPAEVSAVAVGVGPGPYTGLRVGLVTARTFAYLCSVPLHGVCSLDALAAESGRSGEYLVCSDARRQEIYWARYEGLRRVEGPAVDTPATVAERFPGLPVVGRGGKLYAAVLGPWAGLDHVSAAWVARVALAGLAGQAAELLPAEPLYLRRPDTSQPRVAIP